MQSSAANPAASPAPVAEVSPAWAKASAAKMEDELATKYGDAQRPRLQRGLRQVAEFWRAEDGDAGL